MRDDIQRARDLGADGVVLGVLTRQGSVDVEHTAQLVAEARPMKVTFNRAFDVSSDLDCALEDVIETRCDRILTSGGQRLGMRGAARLAGLVKSAGSRIVILGGGGIRSSNVRDFVAATGVGEVHTSLRTRVEATPQHQETESILGAESSAPAQYVVTNGEVQKLRKAVDSIVAPAK